MYEDRPVESYSLKEKNKKKFYIRDGHHRVSAGFKARERISRLMALRENTEQLKKELTGLIPPNIIFSEKRPSSAKKAPKIKIIVKNESKFEKQ